MRTRASYGRISSREMLPIDMPRPCDRVVGFGNRREGEGFRADDATLDDARRPARKRRDGAVAFVRRLPLGDDAAGRGAVRRREVHHLLATQSTRSAAASDERGCASAPAWTKGAVRARRVERRRVGGDRRRRPAAAASASRLHATRVPCDERRGTVHGFHRACLVRHERRRHPRRFTRRNRTAFRHARRF